MAIEPCPEKIGPQESGTVTSTADDAHGDVKPEANTSSSICFHDLDIVIHDGEITYGEAQKLGGKSIVGYNAVWPTGDDRPEAQWKMLHATNLAGGGGFDGWWAATREECAQKIRDDIRGTWRFWEEKVRWAENGDRTEDGRRVIRRGGWHYVVGAEQYAGMRGFGGARWAFRLLADGRVIHTTNLWFQGEIPAEFLGRLPDNAEQLPDDATHATAATTGGAA
jgi:hypothetical protein